MLAYPSQAYCAIDQTFYAKRRPASVSRDHLPPVRGFHKSMLLNLDLNDFSSDDKQAEALADLSQSFNWTYIAAVGSDDDMGHDGVEAFKQSAYDKGTCISSEAYFNLDDSDESHLLSIINNLKNKKNDESVVNVVLLFMEWQYASEFLVAANSMQLESKCIFA